MRIQLSDTDGSTALKVRWHGTTLQLMPDGPGDYTATLDPSTIAPGRHRIEVHNPGKTDVEIGDLMVELILTAGH